MKYRKTRGIHKEIANWLGTGKKERGSFLLGIGDRYDRSEAGEQLRTKLHQANISLKPSEYLAISIIVFIVLYLFYAFIVGLGILLSIFIAELTHWVIKILFFRTRKQRYAEEINKQLPTICRLLGNTVKAGLTIPQGIDRIVADVQEPAQAEFKRMQNELSLGNDFAEVIERARERIPSKEVAVFFNTIIIQREVGGNLAEALHLMATTLEERERVGKEIKALTAESKTTAMMLPILPVFMLIMLSFLMDGFIRPLFTIPGLILLGVIVFLQILAFVLIRKISKIQV